jgi:hypothetical protein
MAPQCVKQLAMGAERADRPAAERAGEPRPWVTTQATANLIADRCGELDRNRVAHLFVLARAGAVKDDMQLSSAAAG